MTGYWANLTDDKAEGGGSGSVLVLDKNRGGGRWIRRMVCFLGGGGGMECMEGRLMGEVRLRVEGV